MAFADAVNNALDALYSTSRFGVSATFAPAAGDESTFNVILDSDPSYQPGGSVQVAEPQITISYRRLNIDRKVKRGETFTIGGTVYTVRGMADFPGAWTAYEGKASVLEA